MSVTTILAKAAMPCILVGGGITAGASVEPIKRAVHHRVHKPMARKVVVTPVCIDPIAVADIDGVLPGGGVFSLAATPTVPQSIGRWSVSPPPGVTSYIPPLVTGTPPTETPPVSAIPEPSTWITMLVGMALAAFGLRQKRRAKVVVSNQRGVGS